MIGLVNLMIPQGLRADNISIEIIWPMYIVPTKLHKV